MRDYCNVPTSNTELITSAQEKHFIWIEEIKDAQAQREILLTMEAIEDIGNCY